LDVKMMYKFVMSLIQRYPKLGRVVVRTLKRYFPNTTGSYPRITGGELRKIKEVLLSPNWNMAYCPDDGVHIQVEQYFSRYIGTSEAIVVGSGGVAIQLSLRALGLKAGSRILVQIDTCAAAAQAIMAANCVPVFIDINEHNLMINSVSAEYLKEWNIQCILVTHMWGRPDNIEQIMTVARASGVFVIEDACLSLGGSIGHQMLGSFADVGIFSFGCIKPVQAGEGGIITTNNSDLAKELRALRSWGDRTHEFGVRDVVVPSWNGRISEVLCALILEQMKGYPKHLNHLHDNAEKLNLFLRSTGLGSYNLGSGASIQECSFTQAVIELNPRGASVSTASLIANFRSHGLVCWYPNFEPLNRLTLFQDKNWEKWTAVNSDDIASNYSAKFEISETCFDSGYLGVSKSVLLSDSNLKRFQKVLEHG
jgi:dTDP-4-amino-4,6-dideoxygalactose transaminase